MNTGYLVNRPYSDFTNCPNNVSYSKNKIKQRKKRI